MPTHRNIKRYLLASTTVLLALMARIASAAPVTWSTNGHQYEYIAATSISWTDASAAAQAIGTGWNLASITSQAEEDFVVSLITGSIQTNNEVWLGGTDEGIEGTWTWTDGELFLYSDWWAGEPNDFGAGEDYLALKYDNAWHWNDAANSAEDFIIGYIVESTPVPVPPALWLLSSSILGLLGMMRRKSIPA